MQLTKGQRRYLSRFGCGLCEQRLDRLDCSAIYAPRCTSGQIERRARRCLKGYKPRASRE